MHQVRRRVGPRDGAPPLDVDLRQHLLPHPRLARDDACGVHRQVGQRLLHVAHLQHRPVGEHEAPAVGELPAGLGVERRPVQHDLHARALRRRLGDLAVDEQPAQHRLGAHLAVAGEGGRPGRLEQRAVRGRVGPARLARAAVGLRARPLLLHEPPEARLVDREPLLGGHLEGEVDREAVRVVQRERAVAGQHAARLPRSGDRGVEDLGPGAERLEERPLLRHRHRGDAPAVADQLGVLRPHRPDAGVDELLHRRVLRAEQSHRPDRAAHDAAQHVAAALVGRRDPVADEHHRGARVVGHHPQADVGVAVGAVAHPGQLGGAVEDRAAGVDLVQVVDALQHGGHPLHAHAGVDVLLRQRPEHREVVALALAALVLHEHEVPDLQEPLAVDGRAALGAVRRTPVVEDLGVRAAGPGDAHVPVVVGHPEPLDPRGRHSLGEPELLRLVVVLVDGDPQPVLGQPVAALGLRLEQQLPGEVDRAGLEVVAEAEVAGHLEERAVPGRLADLLDVEGAHALLHADGALVRRRLLTEEERLERHHAGVDQQQRRVGRDEARARHQGVPARREVVEEARADLVGPHRRSPGRSASTRSWLPSSPSAVRSSCSRSDAAARTSSRKVRTLSPSPPNPVVRRCWTPAGV